MKTRILIAGYGNIGKHMYKEFAKFSPDIYDPNISEYAAKRDGLYDFAFICVPTDMLENGGCDVSVVERAVRETSAKTVVIKSTIPPGTTDRLIRETGKTIVFSPENYGVTQHCPDDPGFVILGGKRDDCDRVARLYSEVKTGYYSIRYTDAATAELWKYMLNCFLALKVTFCNEFADIASKIGASYSELRELFICDDRVGASHTFVYPDKPYYDSHCFNKDIPALVEFAGELAPLMASVNEINRKRKNTPVECDADRLYIGKAPVSLLLQAEIQRKNRACSLRSALIEKTKSAEFKYYCSLCLIIRDENEYLREWLDWHIAQGAEHFYIYDHGSKQPVEEYVKALGSDYASRITFVDWSGKHKDAQPEAYNDCLNRFRGESRWIGFIDADEQIRIKTGAKLPEFLRSYEDYAALYAIWITYNANGMPNKSAGLLRDRFTRECHANSWYDQVGKLIVQPMYMSDMVIHNGIAEDGFEIVDENKNKIYPYSLIASHPSVNKICVDHFYTKSYEEWLQKLRRGTCHAKFMRQYEEFFTLNPDMEYAREDIDVQQKYEQFQ